MNTVSAPAGIGAPVKMRTACAGLDRVARGVAGGDPIDDDEALFAVRIEIVAAHRITVDRRIIERRDIDGRDDIFRQHAA